MKNFDDSLIAEPFRKQSEEVFFATASIVRVGKAQISSLKESARTNARHRVRLCTHPGTTDRLHEMMIIHCKDTYVRPHKHANKSESFHVIEGFVDVVLFDDAGEILKVISMGDYPSGKMFYCRLSEPFYHTLMIRSQMLIFHEITNGPFKREETLFAPWAPQENETSRIMGFLDQLNCRIEQFSLSQARDN